MTGRAAPSAGNRPANFSDQFGQWPRSIEPQSRAGQCGKPGLMLCQTASLAVAIVAMRSPFDELFGLAISTAAGSHRIGAEMPCLAGAQASQPKPFRGDEENHEVKQGMIASPQPSSDPLSTQSARAKDAPVM